MTTEAAGTSNNPSAKADPNQPMVYHIRIRGHLGPRWESWFEGMAITQEESGDTLLTGPLVDQAALHGVLKTVRDLGLPLRSIMEVQPKLEDAPGTR